MKATRGNPNRSDEQARNTEIAALERAVVAAAVAETNAETMRGRAHAKALTARVGSGAIPEANRLYDAIAAARGRRRQAVAELNTHKAGER